MESVLKSYIHKFNEIIAIKRSKLPKIIPLYGEKEGTIGNQQFFEEAVNEAEETMEFREVTKALETITLSSDLERLANQEAERRNKLKKKFKLKPLDKWTHDIACNAAKAFFRNTGAYGKLWQGSYVNESVLLSILSDYKNDSELIRLFVFDGFVPYHDKKQLNNISLPIGELKKYTEDEIKELLSFPQCSWHGNVNIEMIKKTAIWYILTIKENEKYRGITGIWLDGACLSSFGWDEIGMSQKKEGDIGIIGPVFLCLGQDANLAVEIHVRTNVFEYFPVFYKVRNDYLPWDEDDSGPRPRTCIKNIGEGGNKLRKIYEIWQNVNDLDGLLRYPAEAYVRSLMNLHASWDSLMEAFVGFVTAIESILTPGSRHELSYKLAMRGAAILNSQPDKRMHFRQVLDEFYKTRSQIVHEGRTDKMDFHDFENMICRNLAKISRQIFLRYICLLNIGLNGELPTWVLTEPSKLKSKKSRPKTIEKILDALILSPVLTEQLETRMYQWGVYEDWIRRGFQ